MDNTEVKITFQNKVTGFSGKTGLMAYEEKLKSVKNLIENMPKNLNFGGNVDKKLETTNKLLVNLNKNMSSFKRSATSALGNMSKDVTQINKKTQKLNKSNTELGEKVKTAFNFGILRQFGIELERLVTNSTKYIRKSAEYTENLNLLSVAFKEQGVEIEKTTNEAMKFVNTLSDMYGLDESKLIRMTGLFKQMANSLGITNEAGTKLSQTLTQLSVDAASLFNAQEIEDAARVFQSALASQTKPIRGFTGADITEQTLQVTLDTYGIDEAISNLSYAEKRLVIVASLVDQLDESIGDFGRTIESPANQMKIFTEQVQRLARAIGNVLMPVFSKILPYINAFMMVLVELTNYIANFIGELFGYDFEGYNPFAGIDDSITDLEEDMNGAAESAKKLKSGLRGFDKLNVISSSSKKDDGIGAGSGVGGAYYDLLDQAVEKYNKKLEKTKMLATKIRDNILEWLGFSVETDKATGKLKLKFEKITAGTVLGALAVGGTIFSGVKKILDILKKFNLIKFTAFTTLTKKVKELVTLTKNGTLLKTIGSNFTALVTKVKTLLPLIGKVSIAIAGIAGVVWGSSGTYNAMKKMTEEAEYGGKEYAKYTASVLATAGGATALGAVLGGPLGAVIGGLTGTVIAGVSAWKGYNDAIEAMAKGQLFGSLSISLEQWDEILTNNTSKLPDYAAQYSQFQETMKSLEETFETNLNSLELYGYKFGVVNQQITEKDSVQITKSIEEMCNSTSQMIEESSNLFLSVWGDRFEKMSVMTEEEEKNILQKVIDYSTKQQTELKTAQDNITKTYENAINQRGYLTDEEYKYIKEQLQKIKDLTKREMSVAYTDALYLQKTWADDSSKLSEESYKRFKEALNTYNNEQLKIIGENYNTERNLAQRAYDEGVISYEEYLGLLKSADDGRINDEETLRTELDKIQKGVYEDLANHYVKIEKETDRNSKEMKKLIRGIFKDAGYDEKDIKKFSTFGEDVGKNYAKGIEKGFNSKRLKFNVPNDNPFGIKDYSFSLQASVLGYAQGGLPPVGQLFVANERGPELVGQIGGQSFVANQDQVLELLDRKIANANTGISNATFVIQVGSKEISRTVLNDLQNMAKSNGKPITIS